MLFVDIDEHGAAELRARFGDAAVRPMRAFDLDFCRGVDQCLTHAERLLRRGPNGFLGRGGARARRWPTYPAILPDGLIGPGAELPLETPQCHFVALNVSKQDDPGRDLEDADPVAVALGVAARQMLVVVAAGNEGTRTDLADTLSPWARMPAVLAVGATEDELGRHIAPYSGRGSNGPPVLAWGLAGDTSGEIGTSFAAPRVVREALVLAAFLHTLRDAFAEARGDGRPGIPLVGAAMVDSGRAAWPAEQLAIPAYPRIGIDVEAVRPIAMVDAAMHLTPDERMLRRAVLRSGRPMSDGHAVFVSRQTTLSYLSRFDDHELAALTSSEALARVATGRTVLDLTKLHKAIEVWDHGSLHLYVEESTGEATFN